MGYNLKAIIVERAMRKLPRRPNLIFGKKTGEQGLDETFPSYRFSRIVWLEKTLSCTKCFSILLKMVAIAFL